MILRNYFETEFWEDVKRIELSRPNETILKNPEDFYLHKQAKFFGGKDWENYTKDISNITKKNEFVLSMFIISTIDFFIKNNTELYTTIKQKYDPPKLGWCGLGPHFEHPFKIFQIINNYYPNSIFDRKEEIKDLFNKIFSEYDSLNFDAFKKLVTNNMLNIPERFNDPVYFIFLNEVQEQSWNEIMVSILND
jgi:hypothetical protein